MAYRKGGFLTVVTVGYNIANSRLAAAVAKNSSNSLKSRSMNQG